MRRRASATWRAPRGTARQGGICPSCASRDSASSAPPWPPSSRMRARRAAALASWSWASTSRPPTAAPRSMRSTAGGCRSRRAMRSSSAAARLGRGGWEPRGHDRRAGVRARVGDARRRAARRAARRRPPDRAPRRLPGGDPDARVPACARTRSSSSRPPFRPARPRRSSRRSSRRGTRERGPAGGLHPPGVLLRAGHARRVVPRLDRRRSRAATPATREAARTPARRSCRRSSTWGRIRSPGCRRRLPASWRRCSRTATAPPSSPSWRSGGGSPKRSASTSSSVISTIRQRPTHSNMRRPGFGVGGYCLTKDPLMAGHLGRASSIDRPDLRVPVLVARRERQPGDAAGEPAQARRAAARAASTERRSLLMGVSYREDVADTRHSPSETFVREARRPGRDGASATTRSCATGPSSASGCSAIRRRRRASTLWSSPFRTRRTVDLSLSAGSATRGRWCSIPSTSSRPRSARRWPASAAPSRASDAASAHEPRAHHRRRRIHRRPPRRAPRRRGARGRPRRRLLARGPRTPSWPRCTTRAGSGVLERDLRRPHALDDLDEPYGHVIHLAAIVGVRARRPAAAGGRCATT